MTTTPSLYNIEFQSYTACLLVIPSCIQECLICNFYLFAADALILIYEFQAGSPITTYKLNSDATTVCIKQHNIKEYFVSIIPIIIQYYYNTNNTGFNINLIYLSKCIIKCIVNSSIYVKCITKGLYWLQNQVIV